MVKASTGHKNVHTSRIRSTTRNTAASTGGSSRGAFCTKSLKRNFIHKPVHINTYQKYCSRLTSESAVQATAFDDVRSYWNIVKNEDVN